MYCFGILIFYYAFQLGILAADSLLRNEACRSVSIRKRLFHYLNMSKNYSVGNSLFQQNSWLQMFIFYFATALTPCHLDGTNPQFLLLANALPAAFHLLVAAVFIRARMASIMVKYSFFSGALFFIAMTLNQATWPILPRDKWIFRFLPGGSALMYVGFLIVTGWILIRRPSDDLGAGAEANTSESQSQ